jgi:hypothetical protein
MLRRISSVSLGLMVAGFAVLGVFASGTQVWRFVNRLPFL